MSEAMARWYWPFPIAKYISSSSAIFLGRKVYGAERSHIFMLAFAKARKINDAWWAIKYRAQWKHKYHLVDTGLHPGYHDVDERMLHACMSLLCEHVDRCCGGTDKLRKWTEDLEADTGQWGMPVDGQANSQREMLEIYHWWKVTRPADQRREAETLRAGYSGYEWGTKETGHKDFVELTWPVPTEQQAEAQKEHREIENKISREEDEMMIRLMKIRGALWL